MSISVHLLDYFLSSLTWQSPLRIVLRTARHKLTGLAQQYVLFPYSDFLFLLSFDSNVDQNNLSYLCWVSHFISLQADEIQDRLEREVHVIEPGSETDDTVAPNDKGKAKSKPKESKRKVKAKAKSTADRKPSWPGLESPPSRLCEWYLRQKQTTGRQAFIKLHSADFDASDANLKRYRCFVDYVGYEAFLEWTQIKSPAPLRIRDSHKKFPEEWDRAK